MREYEHDRWRIVAGKVGHGFSASACRDKATELEAEDEQEEEEEEESHQHQEGTPTTPGKVESD